MDCVLQPMQYVSLTGALQDATIVLKAKAFFVKKTHSRFGLWNRFWTWRLNHVMHSTACKLYLVDEATRMIDWVPLHTPCDEAQYPLKAELLS